MNIYSKKQRWKFLLFSIAFIIVGFSLWYTDTLVSKIALDERQKIKLWGDAIRKKAKLVVYTNELFEKITAEEHKKVELWANGTRQLANPTLQMEDVSFIFDVIKNNETVPVILADENNVILSYRNLDSARTTDKQYLQAEMKAMQQQHQPIVIKLLRGKKNYLYYKDSKLFSELKIVLDDLVKSFISEVAVNSAAVPVILTDSARTRLIAFGNIDSLKIATPELLKKEIAKMESSNPPIIVDFGDEGKQYLFYKDSRILTQLRYYPYILFVIVGLFLIIAYTLFSTARDSEQNQVWVGMAKETAHQLGTPLSSLMAWVEYLKEKQIDASIIHELEKDVSRLSTITERFSKIGSVPKLATENIYTVLEDAINYLKTRTSKNVTYRLEYDHGRTLFAQLNIPLFAWVIENICKNAVDAMDGNGSIGFKVTEVEKFIFIDITDTGKGLPKSKFKTIFKPGYTTKSRGWGLGLTICKRIIENYHSGKLLVKSSEPGKGTTFRIQLNQ